MLHIIVKGYNTELIDVQQHEQFQFVAKRFKLKPWEVPREQVKDYSFE